MGNRRMTAPRSSRAANAPSDRGPEINLTAGWRDLVKLRYRGGHVVLATMGRMRRLRPWPASYRAILAIEPALARAGRRCKMSRRIAVCVTENANGACRRTAQRPSNWNWELIRRQRHCPRMPTARSRLPPMIATAIPTCEAAQAHGDATGPGWAPRLAPWAIRRERSISSRPSAESRAARSCARRRPGASGECKLGTDTICADAARVLSDDDNWEPYDLGRKGHRQ
jgi:hypothetical protein